MPLALRSVLACSVGTRSRCLPASALQTPARDRQPSWLARKAPISGLGSSALVVCHCLPLPGTSFRYSVVARHVGLRGNPWELTGYAVLLASPGWRRSPSRGRGHSCAPTYLNRPNRGRACKSAVACHLAKTARFARVFANIPGGLIICPCDPATVPLDSRLVARLAQW